jgi:ABC-type glycerol-3-phosphate transport system permease component
MAQQVKEMPTTTRPVATPRAKNYRLGRLIERVLLYLVVAIGAAASMLPFYWTVISSGKDISEFYRYPPTWWPEAMKFAENYYEVWTIVPMGLWFVNTFIITFLALVGTVLSATLVAYGFARFRFPGRELFFYITLATMMLPTEVTLIPTYLMFKNFDWIDTWYPLWVPAGFGGGAFNIFLMRQFFMTIPFDLDEAARLDGANSWRTLWQILMPLCRPAIATMATLGFIGNWNNFLGPLIFLNTESKYTVAVGLRYFQSSVAQGMAVAKPQDHLLMGAAIMVALPCLILFFLGQKYFVQGIVTTGIKG